MAGVAGIAKPNQWNLITASLEKIKHRGKGSYVSVEDTNATLGETHPSPMGMWLGRTPGCRAICDGAIYNWRKLDEEALDVDQALQNLYERKGPSFVSDLDGPFALAIAGENGLFMTRDTLGACPLYCGISDGAACFASEVKALLGWAEEIREFPPGHYYHPRSGIVRFSKFAAKQPERMQPF